MKVTVNIPDGNHCYIKGVITCPFYNSSVWDYCQLFEDDVTSSTSVPEKLQKCLALTDGTVCPCSERV